MRKIMMGLTLRELRSDAALGSGTGSAPDSTMGSATGPAMGSARWYALTVKHQHERTVQSALQSKRMTTLVPLYRSRQQWSDRSKEIDVPLFAGYIFCRFPYDERVRVLTTPGVRRIVGFGDSPTPVDDAEITAIETMMQSNTPIRPWPHLKPGDRVRVERGPLRGLIGTLIREKDVFRLVIGVELLQRSIAAEVSPDMIAPLSMSATC
jgi:transcription antitermination factor NusG